MTCEDSPAALGLEADNSKEGAPQEAAAGVGVRRDGGWDEGATEEWITEKRVRATVDRTWRGLEQEG